MILCCDFSSYFDWKVMIPVLTASLSLYGSFRIWRLNSISNRRQELYKRKEERYAKLLESLKGFYVNTQNKELKEEFLKQINLCWLYCPDIVILKIYSFIQMAHTKQERVYDDVEKEIAVGDFILEIRKDLIKNKKISSTKLSPKDFKLLSATNTYNI